MKYKETEITEMESKLSNMKEVHGNLRMEKKYASMEIDWMEILDWDGLFHVSWNDIS